MSLGKEWEEAYGYADALRAGELLFCSGQVGLEEDGTAPADPARQYDLAFAAVGSVLAGHGLGPEHLVELVTFHTDYPEHRTEFRAARARFERGHRPAWTAVGVAAVGTPGTLVEIKAPARFRD